MLELLARELSFCFSISDESNGLLNRTTSDDQTSQNTTLPSPSGEALGLPSPSLSHEQQTPPKKPPRLNSTPQQLSPQRLHFRGSTIPDLSPVRTFTKATKQVHGDHDGVSGLKNKQTLKAQKPKQTLHEDAGLTKVAMATQDLGSLGGARASPLRIRLTSPTFDDDEGMTATPPAVKSTASPPKKSPRHISRTSNSSDDDDDESPEETVSSASPDSGVANVRSSSKSDCDPATPSTASPISASNSTTVQNSSRSSAPTPVSRNLEENFESYGENDDIEYENGDYDYVLSRVTPAGPEGPEALLAAPPGPGSGHASNGSGQESDQGTPAFRRNSPHRNGSIRRNAWMRSSLRRPPPPSGGASGDQLVPPRRCGSFRMPKRPGSNAHASALYHGGNGGASFNSSGRSSNCDDGDMQSDISLEEDVNDLNQKVQQLQEQVHGLAESQATTDDRYSKVKQENALLTQKIHMLEENIREVEIRSEERLETERKRNRDALQRVEREKQLEIENYSIRLQTLEKEYGKLEAEAAQLRAQSDRLRQEKAELEDQLSESRYALSEAESRVVKLEDLSKREADRSDQERHSSAQLIEELSKEVEELRSKVSSVTSGVSYGSGSVDIVDSTGGGRDGNLDGGNVNGVTLDSEIRQRVSELDSEVRKLREENRQLTESNEEMQAASLLNRGLEQGKTLLSNIDAAPSSSMSIADELGGMSDFQDMSFGSMSDELDQVKRALKEQQDVNSQLRSYIDGILMNIMEKYPEILEVRK